MGSPRQVGTVFAGRGEGPSSHFTILSIKIAEAVTRANVCQSAVSPAYVKDNALHTASVLGVRYTQSMVSKTRAGPMTLLAFIIATRGKTDDDFYIDVVCAERGHGTPLIKAALQYGREHGYRTASLSALPHVKDYYTQFRFRAGSGDPCAPGVAAERIAATGGSVISGYRFRKCLTGTTSAANYVATANRGGYALPPRQTASTVTRETGNRVASPPIKPGPATNPVSSGRRRSPAGVANPVSSGRRRSPSVVNLVSSGRRRSPSVVNLVSSDDDNTAATSRRARAARVLAVARRSMKR